MTSSKLGTDSDTQQIVELSQASRRQGLYIIGANGTGKTGLIEHLILQDIDQGLGVGLLDPHGDLVNAILAKMTKREDDVILLDIQDEDHPFGLNVFACPNPQSNTAVQKIVDLVMHIFEKLYDVSRQTPRMAQFLRNCTHTLVANPGYTMADIPLLLQDKEWRSKLVANVTDPKVRLFWKTYEALKPSEQFDRAESTLNKMDELLQPLTCNIVGQAHTTVNIQQVMDDRKILLVKLSAQLDQVTSLVGTLFIALFLNAAYSRANIPINKRKQFNLYADEFQRFATEDFATLLTEARKFGIATTIAHQARYQPGMTDGIRAVSLQAANHVVFRVTSPDADELAGGFDITPQAAWEEEIEKERFEVLKAEWYERREEEVIDGTEPIMTVRQGDIIQHLDRKGHDNKRVMELFSKYITPLISQSYRVYQYHPDDPLDTFFVAGMHGRFLHTSPDLQEKVFYIVYGASMTRMESFFLKKYTEFVNGHSDSDMKVLLDEYPTDTDIQNAVKTFIATYCVNPGQQRGFFPANAGKTLQEVFYWELLQLCFNWSLPVNKSIGMVLAPNTASYIDFSRISMTPTEQQWYQEKLIRVKKDKIEIDAIYNSASDFEIRMVAALGTSAYPDSIKNAVTDAEMKQLNYGREQALLCYRNGLHDTSFEMQQRQQYARQLAQDMVARLQDFILGITELAYELSKPENHIMEDSGSSRPRKRKQINILTHPAQTIVHPRKVIMHPQRTFQDVKNDIANQLSGFSNFTARVKIGDNVPQNPGKKCLKCKLLNRYGAKYCSSCGKQLPAANEYTFTTLKPLGGLGKAALQQRLTTIQGNNIQKGYVRDRTKVEAEIINRQTQCSGSAPAQPHKPQQPSPQQAQARHARQVPVQGKCPNCGAANASSAKFCNQCGTRL